MDVNIFEAEYLKIEKSIRSRHDRGVGAFILNQDTLKLLSLLSDEKSDAVAVTMNVYTHLGLDDAREELTRLKEARNVMKLKSVM